MYPWQLDLLDDNGKKLCGSSTPDWSSGYESYDAQFCNNYEKFQRLYKKTYCYARSKPQHWTLVWTTES